MTNEQKARNIAIHEMRYYGGEFDSYKECRESAIKMAEWKDEQYNEEKKELLGLVNMLKIDETNQTIIEDLQALLQ